MGSETLDINTYGHSKGRSGSFSVNDQQAGRELLTPDEVRMLPNRKAILFVRGERPMLDDKYDLLRHPNIKLTPDGGAAPYVTPYDFMQMAVSISPQELETIEPDKIPEETLNNYELIDLEELDYAL